jgi:O2-independent ubiquinone biosynthesis accessory factor UbiT
MEPSMNISLPAPPPPPEALRRLIERLPVRPPSILLAMVLNRTLLPKLDADARCGLAGRCVEVVVNDFGVRFRLQLGDRGFAPAAAQAVVALRISASAAVFWSLAEAAEDADTLFFERKLLMQGDTEYGLLLKNTLDAIGPLVPEILVRRS